jgi:DNA-binding IclR family transcriptional regulator
VLAAVRERPGVTTRELAAASGVTGGTLYSLLRRLTEQGELAKRELPGGQTGYALASGAAAPSGGVGRPAGGEDSAQTHVAEAATESRGQGDPRVSGSPDASD